jgi:peptidoglycan/LPS O-acetylase OafA/YrhL
MPTKDPKTRIDFIDGLRAVAIALVVCFHTHLPGVPNGFLGVDVFFVISGFLITGQIFDQVRTGSFSATNFFARRIMRIFPPLLLVVTAVLVAACLLPILPLDTKRIALSAMFSAAMVSNWYFLANADYFAPSGEREPLLHLWSLGVEEQYYLVAPAMVLAFGVLARRLRADAGLLWLGAAAALLAISLAAAIGYAAQKPALVFFATPLRAWEFATGAVAVLLLRRGMALPRALARAGALVALAAIMVASAAWPLSEHRLLLQGVATLGAGSVLSCGSFANGGIACRLLRMRLMVGLGLISYSLYLWHWPLLVLVRLTQLDPPTPLQTLLAGVMVPVLLAILTYLAVERPIRAWRRRGGSARAGLGTIAQGIAASMLIGSTAAAVAIAAGQLNSTDRFRPFAEATARIMEKCRAGARDEGPLAACRIGTGSDARVLLWGDSHALSISPAIDTIAAEAGLSGHVQWDGGCPPLPGNTIYVGDTTWTACMRQNDRVLRWLAAPELQSVTGVILAAAWMRGLWAATPAGAVADAAKLRDAMIRTIGELHGSGLRVLVLGQVPGVPFPAPECIFRAQSEAELRRCRYVSSEVDVMHGDIDTALRTAASQFDNTRFMEVKAAFCDHDYCWPGRGGSIYYSDTNHLSVSGARAVRDRYKDDFVWALAAPTRSTFSKAAATRR